MNQRNTNNGTPQPIETNDEFDLPPPAPHDPIEPDPMNSNIPVPPDEEPPPAPVREPDKKLPVREPNRKKPTEIV